MPSRPLWSGAISFGLVSVPVRLHPAIAEHKLHFHLIHEPDESPIGYQKICKAEEKAVPDDEVVKAFELTKGEYVVLTDEDFELARAGSTRAIEITDFVPLADIDPLLFAKAYYVAPGAGGEKVYALLARAMERSGLAGVVKFVMRDRQHLGALRATDGLIVLEQLHFADELRPVAGIKPEGQRLSKKELALAEGLIDALKGPWRPESYKDTYRDELCALIEAKRRGESPEPAAETEATEPTDLMEALRRSVEAASSGRARSRPKKRAGASSAAKNGRGRASR